VARPTRIDLPGGWYHVVNRGIERREIFTEERSFEHFLELLSNMPERFTIKIHGYVLMGNHYHLQGLFVAGAGPIGWCHGIPRGNHGNPSI
jgi:putative transposase